MKATNIRANLQLYFLTNQNFRIGDFVNKELILFPLVESFIMVGGLASFLSQLANQEPVRQGGVGNY